MQRSIQHTYSNMYLSPSSSSVVNAGINDRTIQRIHTYTKHFTSAPTTRDALCTLHTHTYSHYIGWLAHSHDLHAADDDDAGRRSRLLPQPHLLHYASTSRRVPGARTTESMDPSRSCVQAVRLRCARCVSFHIFISPRTLCVRRLMMLGLSSALERV